MSSPHLLLSGDLAAHQAEPETRLLVSVALPLPPPPDQPEGRFGEARWRACLCGNVRPPRARFQEGTAERRGWTTAPVNWGHLLIQASLHQSAPY